MHHWTVTYTEYWTTNKYTESTPGAVFISVPFMTKDVIFVFISLFSYRYGSTFNIT